MNSDEMPHEPVMFDGQILTPVESTALNLLRSKMKFVFDEINDKQITVARIKALRLAIDADFKTFIDSTLRPPANHA